MKTVLSTKTLDGITLAFAQTLSLDVRCADFIETKPLLFNIEHINFAIFDAVAFTSANAVNYFFENNRAADLIAGKQIFALQGKTTGSLLSRGITANLQAASADELADEIVKGKTCKAVLHICGEMRLPVLESKLKQAGLNYAEMVIYQTIVQTAKKIDESFDAILFFSPSGVEGFTALNDSGKAVCCCIGKTTANALKDKNNTARIILPEQPSPSSMLSAVKVYFQNHHQS
jgi:uroporphyrinogen-III synthase